MIARRVVLVLAWRSSRIVISPDMSWPVVLSVLLSRASEDSGLRPST